MTPALFFWVLMTIWLVLGAAVTLRKDGSGWAGVGGNILVFLLFLILGCAQFGSPIQ